MRTALVNPPAPVAVEEYDLPDYGEIGTGYLAGMLESHGEPVAIFDCRLSRMSMETLAAELGAGRFDVVGVTAMTHNIMHAGDVVRRVKTLNPEIRTVIGGVHATAAPIETMQHFPELDFLVRGEGEYILVELLDALKGNRSLREVAGIAYRENGRIILNPSAPRPESLDDLPFPAWHLFPKCRTYHIMSTRGCPFPCVFCMSPYGRDGVRERSIENTVNEIALVIDRYQPRRIRFNDETFALNRQRAMPLLKTMIDRRFSDTVEFSASCRTTSVDRELLKTLRRAGFTYIDYGIETGSPVLMKAIGKRQTLESVRRAIALTKEAGIKPGCNFIFGHPNETLETAHATIDLAVELNGHVTAFGIMCPYPGTQVAELAKRGEGGYKLLSTDWRDYNKQLGDALELENLSRLQLEWLQLQGYLKVLLYNWRVVDLAGFVWQHRRAAAAFIRKFSIDLVRTALRRSPRQIVIPQIRYSTKTHSPR